MFGVLREQWEHLDAPQIIKQLDEYSLPFLSIHGKADATAIYGPDVGKYVRKLVDLNRPASVYPFVMPLLKQFHDAQIAKDTVIECLTSLESFLVRRALCGIEPTGLLGLFRTMWANAAGHPTASVIESIILKRRTVEWPTDQRLREAIKSRPLYGASIAKFAVLEYDRSQGMDHPVSSAVSIEHILPNSYADDWKNVVTKIQHGKLRHLWENLIPLSMVMNTSVDQQPYELKRKVFENDSMFASARQLAKDYQTWGESEINARSEVLADWAIARWPRPADFV